MGIHILKKILGKKLGANIYTIIDRLELAEKELDIVHKTLTDLYNLNDTTVPLIQKCLRKLKKLECKE
jgi:hypothetical protein